MYSVFIANLPSRPDRRCFIKKEFRNKTEFDIEIINPIANPKPNISLWLTIQQIVREQVKKEDDYFIFCEDDHQFTKNYNASFLKKCITEARRLDADILSGGVSWQKTSIQVSDNLFWMENFSGLQFTVIFKKFYNAILTASFGDKDAADHKISELTNKKFVIYPAISTQKEFGYSDVTLRNNAKGRVDFLFEKSNMVFDSLNKIRNHYLPKKENKLPYTNPDDIVLPVYIINLKERTERFDHIVSEFAGREEFEPQMIEAVKDKNGRMGLWKSILKAVETAIAHDDDFFILCEDDHVFTEHYNCNRFINHILQAHYHKADLLSGGIGGFGLAVPVAADRYWVDWFWCTQFVVIYPFISTQKDFGYSDVTVQNNEKKGLISKFFEDADKRLAVYREVFLSYE